MNHLIQQSPEWHNLRKSKIGASDAPAIMEVSPWKTPYQLWVEKLGLAEQKQTIWMKIGIEKEEEARQAFEKETGIIVFPEVVFSNEYDWMMASLDGIDIERKHIVEIKCAGKEDHECAMDGEIPEKYYPQLQHQMIVCNLDKAFYFSYSDNSYKVLEIYRDKEYNSLLIEKESMFFKCLEELNPPSLIDKDFIHRNDEIWKETANKWLEINSKMKSLEKEEKEIRDLLLKMADGRNIKGAGISISKVNRKGSVDYNSIPELKKINLNEYRKDNIISFKISREN